MNIEKRIEALESAAKHQCAMSGNQVVLKLRAASEALPHRARGELGKEAKAILALLNHGVLETGGIDERATK